MSADIKSEEVVGYGMKAVLAIMNFKFPKVNHLPTSELGKWMQSASEEETSGTKNPEAESSEKSGSKDRIVILDARPEEEYIVSHLPGAIRVDHDRDISPELVASIIKSPEADSNRKVRVVCYCAVGYRSSILAEKLESIIKENQEEKPEIDVYNLEGSIFKWANESRQMVDNENQPTIFAHQYSVIFGKLLNYNLRKSTA